MKVVYKHVPLPLEELQRKLDGVFDILFTTVEEKRREKKLLAEKRV
jgi:hypothetical protein